MLMSQRSLVSSPSLIPAESLALARLPGIKEEGEPRPPSWQTSREAALQYDMCSNHLHEAGICRT